MMVEVILLWNNGNYGAAWEAGMAVMMVVVVDQRRMRASYY